MEVSGLEGVMLSSLTRLGILFILNNCQKYIDSKRVKNKKLYLLLLMSRMLRSFETGSRTALP